MLKDLWGHTEPGFGCVGACRSYGIRSRVIGVAFRPRLDPGTRCGQTNHFLVDLLAPRGDKARRSFGSRRYKDKAWERCGSANNYDDEGSIPRVRPPLPAGRKPPLLCSRNPQLAVAPNNFINRSNIDNDTGPTPQS